MSKAKVLTHEMKVKLTKAEYDDMWAWLEVTGMDPANYLRWLLRRAARERLLPSSKPKSGIRSMGLLVG